MMTEWRGSRRGAASCWNDSRARWLRWSAWECDRGGAVRDYVRMAAPYEILGGACGDGDGAGDEPFSFRLEPED